MCDDVKESQKTTSNYSIRAILGLKDSEVNTADHIQEISADKISSNGNVANFLFLRFYLQ